MRFARLWIASAALLALMSCAQAAEEGGGAVNAITAVSAAQLAVYARPETDSKLREIARDSIALPLKVLDTDERERFLKVEIDKQFVWVKTAQVFVSRSVASGCLVQKQTNLTGGVTRGANEGCKK